MAEDGGGAADANAQVVIANLTQKLAALTQSSVELVQAYAGASDDDAQKLQAQINTVTYEQSACQQRIQDLMAQAAYTRPGQQAETDLMNAVAAVGALVNVTAAINALITASDNLVKAYTAKSTQAQPAG